MAKSFEAQINDAMDDFYQVVRDRYESVAVQMAEECVERLRAVQWETNTGKRYSKTWTYDQRKWGAFYVHNTKNYQLTHLLENGHAVVNAKGDTGERAAPHKHIEPVYIWVQQEIERELRRRLQED